MKRVPLFKYYRVFKNQTTVTVKSANDFKPVNGFDLAASLMLNKNIDGQSPSLDAGFVLPEDELMFYAYTTRVRAMEMAKSGALSYINKMIAEVELGIKRLKDYRSQHYQDLNINLIDANIRKLEREMHIK